MKLKKLVGLLCTVFALVFFLMGSAEAKVKPFVSVDWVKENLSTIKNTKQREIRLIGVSTLNNYRKGHISGAALIEWDLEAINPLTDHMVMTLPQMERVMGKLNINKDTHIVLYDGDNKPHHTARVYWQLKFWNFENVSIMDGGKYFWLKSGNKLTKNSSKFPSNEIKIEYPPNRSIRAMYHPDIIHALATKNALIVDARPAEYYNGKKYILKKWVRSGHIAEAINVSALDNLNLNNLTLKDKSEIKSNFESKGVTKDKNIILYCDSGDLAPLAWIMLHELLGYENVSVYDGSMREYGTRFDTPMVPGKVYKDFPEVPVQGLK